MWLIGILAIKCGQNQKPIRDATIYNPCATWIFMYIPTTLIGMSYAVDGQSTSNPWKCCLQQRRWHVKMQSTRFAPSRVTSFLLKLQVFFWWNPMFGSTCLKLRDFVVNSVVSPWFVPKKMPSELSAPSARVPGPWPGRERVPTWPTPAVGLVWRFHGIKTQRVYDVYEVPS